MSDTTLEDETGCSWREPFALQVLGDSMAPEFPDQCIVLIEHAESCRDGMYIFAELGDERLEERWFRQYRVDNKGRERLVALNRIYPEIDLTGLPWRVLGIIVQRNIRRQVKHYRYAVDADAESA